MAFNPVDFYHLAGWLYTQQNSHVEARARTVISKAYYSAFLVARNKADIPLKTKDVHKVVHAHYFKAGRLAPAKRLDELRVKRNNADYDETTPTITSRDSGIALAQAKKILEELGVTLA